MALISLNNETPDDYSALDFSLQILNYKQIDRFTIIYKSLQK